MLRKRSKTPSVFNPNEKAGPTKLNLAFEGLRDASGFLEQHDTSLLQVLDLSHNVITDLDFLDGFSTLHTLILDSNKITSHSLFPPIHNLTLLSVNDNNIQNLSLFIRNLTNAYPKLKFLSMMKNEAAPSFFNGGTFEQYKDYRSFVISHFPDLSVLDGERVSTVERASSLKVYGRRWRARHGS